MPRGTLSGVGAFLSLVLFVLLMVLAACDQSQDLEAVAGIQGQIQLNGSLPDSVKAVALVILKPEAINDPDNIGNYLINYSDPLSQSGAYYIQLKPGQYMALIVGLLVDPGLFAVNIDQYAASAAWPLVQLSTGAHAILIREAEMQELDWSVDF